MPLPERPPDPQRHVVVMGVSGAGKSRMGRALAEILGRPFLEGDDLHSPQAVAAMAAGHPLDDEDRWPWLRRIRRWLDQQGASGAPGVVACSALRRAYRDVLRGEQDDVVFIELQAPRVALEERLAGRRGHFMPPSLLESQLETLQSLEPDEPGARVRSYDKPEHTLDAVLRAVASPPRHIEAHTHRTRRGPADGRRW